MNLCYTHDSHYFFTSQNEKAVWAIVLFDQSQIPQPRSYVIAVFPPNPSLSMGALGENQLSRQVL